MTTTDPGCHAQQGRRFRRYAQAIDRADDRVLAADALSPAESPLDCWTLSLLLAIDAQGLPPALSGMLHCRGLTARTEPRDQFWTVRAFDA